MRSITNAGARHTISLLKFANAFSDLDHSAGGAITKRVKRSQLRSHRIDRGQDAFRSRSVDDLLDEEWLINRSANQTFLAGFDTQTLHDLFDRMAPLVTKQCPFAVTPKTNEPATWVKPQLVCEVKFTEWTGEGHMRHPVYVGLREDKASKEVHAEKEKPVAKALQAGGE